MYDYIVQLIQQDKMRMQALAALQSLDLPHAYIAAGFVRNLIWDDLHGYQSRTALNDVDVIYFAAQEDITEEKQHQQHLKNVMPQLNWQVKNQAYTHLKHQHQTYQSVLEAMCYWPEQETAIAVRINETNTLELISVFGFGSIFEGYISHNQRVPKAIFEQRIINKKWQQHWLKLKLR